MERDKIQQAHICKEVLQSFPIDMVSIFAGYDKGQARVECHYRCEWSLGVSSPQRRASDKDGRWEPGTRVADGSDGSWIPPGPPKKRRERLPESPTQGPEVGAFTHQVSIRSINSQALLDSLGFCATASEKAPGGRGKDARDRT